MHRGAYGSDWHLHLYKNLERGRRIELLALAWKAKVLPLYEPRILTLVPQVGLEPTRLSALASKTSVATITPPGHFTI